jgi:hypothetical protein
MAGYQFDVNAVRLAKKWIRMLKEDELPRTALKCHDGAATAGGQPSAGYNS